MDMNLLTQDGLGAAEQRRLDKDAERRAVKSVAFEGQKRKVKAQREREETHSAPLEVTVHGPAPTPKAAGKAAGKSWWGRESSVADTDEARRHALLRKVRAYKNAFPDELKKVKEPSANASLAEAQACYDDVILEIRSGDAPKQAVARWKQLLGMLETASVQFPDIVPLQLSSPVSLSAALKNPNIDLHVLKEATEIAIENPFFFTSSPWTRLCEKTFGILMDVHRLNTQGPPVAAATPGPEISGTQ